MVKIVGIFRRLGPIGERFGWNREFERGAWFSGERTAIMLQLVEQYGANRRIVELGCGDGSLARRVVHVPHTSYLGIDVADRATATASEINDPRYSFRTCSMQNWHPDGAFDLLIMEECLYYLGAKAQDALLERAFAAMAPGGVAIFSVRDAEKQKLTLDRIRRQGPIVQECGETYRKYLVVARE